MPFENLSGKSDHDWPGDGIMESVITDLLNVREWVVVDRKSLEKRLAEIEFSHTDIADSDTQLRIGEELAANALVTGTYQVVSDKIAINVRIVGVETGRVMKASKLQGNFPDDYFALQGRIVLNLINEINTYNAPAEKPTARLSEDVKEAIEEKPVATFDAYELYNQAATAFHAKDFDKADVYISDALHRAAAIYEKSLGTDDPQTKDVYSLLSEVYQALGQSSKAREYYLKAR